MIVVDTWAHMSPRGEQETPLDKTTQLGTFAKITTRLYRMLSPWLPASSTAVVLINQIRNKFGDEYHPFTSPGGWALHHECSVRLQTFTPKTEWWDAERNDPKAHEFRFYVEKTKVSGTTRKLHSIFLSNDQDGGFWEYDQLASMWESFIALGLFQDADGNPWKKGKTCYFDALRWDYPKDDLPEDPKLYNLRGALKIENGEDKIKQAIKDDPALLMAVLRAAETTAQANPERIETDEGSTPGNGSADHPESPGLFDQAETSLAVG